MRLAKRLAFFRFDLIFGIVKGEQPLTRCGESGVQKKKPAPRHQRENQLSHLSIIFLFCFRRGPLKGPII